MKNQQRTRRDRENAKKSSKGIFNFFILLSLVFGISGGFAPSVSFADSLQAPDAPKNVVLSKIGKVLIINWELSVTADVLYKVEVYNTLDTVVLSAKNLSSQTNSYSFSNVNTNFYKKARVYAVLKDQSSFAESKGVYQQLYAINANNSFNDISSLSDDSQRAINWQFVYGVAYGFTVKKYEPKKSVTREQMAAFLHRLAGLPKIYNLVNPFVDVDQKNYFLPHILWAFYSGITTGFDALHFRPSQKVTREQMAIFLYRLASKPVIPKIDTPFADCKALSDEAKKAIQWVYNESIVSGYTDTTFMPKKNITREQMAQLLKKYADVMRLSPFIKSESGAYIDNFFATSLKRVDITSFEFINTIPNCENPVDLTDPALTPGAVLACVDGTNVQVGQAGGVIANPDSSIALFRNLKNPNLTKFDISNFDAFNTESLRSAFSEFKINFDLNLPTNFGTRTTNISYIFYFMRIDGKINFCKNFGKNALDAQYAFYFARISSDLVFPDKFCSKTTKMSYFFGYFNNTNDPPLPLGKIVFNAGFGVSGINISYFLYEAEVDSISAFPAGFGKNAEDVSNLIYSTEIKNSGIIIPDNFAINLKYSYNVFAYNTINGDIIIGKNSFQNLILQVVTYFDSDNVTGSIIFGEGCFSNAVSINSLLRNSHIAGDVVFGAGFAKNTPDYSYIFLNTKIQGDIKFNEEFGSAARYTSSMFSEAQFSKEIVLPDNFGANIEMANYMFQNFIFKNTWKFPSKFGEKINDFNRMFARSILNANLDWSSVDFTGRTGADTRGMFENVTWNNHFILVANVGSQAFFTANTGATANNIKVK